MTRSRWILVAALAIPVLLLGGVAAAALLIPRERVAAAVSERAEDALGQRVRIDGVRLLFLPLPGVRLTGISVGGDSDSTALAVVAGAELRARLLPLLRRQVVLDRLALDRPRILLEVDRDGQLNLPFLERDTTAAPDEPPRDIRFEIDRIDVTGGRIGYRDLRDGSVLRLDGWDQRLRLEGEVAGGELARITLQGDVAFADVDARMTDVVVPVRDMALRVTHDATLDRTIDRLDLRAVTVALNGVTLEGAGAIDSVSSSTGRSIELALDAEGLDAAELIGWVPDSLRARLALPDGRRVDVTGTARMSMAIDGPLVADTLPSVDGTLALEEGAATVGGESLMDRVRGEGAFALDSAVLRLTGRALGEPFTAGVAVREPASPVAVIALRAQGELGRLAELGMVPDTLQLSGAVRADIQARLPLRELATAEAAGDIELNGVRLPRMQPAVFIPGATIQLQGERVRVEPLPVRLGEAGVPVTLNLAAENWIPALLDSAAAPPRVVGVLRAETLDLDALLGPSESEYSTLLFARLQDRSIDGMSAAEVADAAGLGLPTLPEVDGELRVLIGRLTRNGLTYSDLDANVRIRPGVAELEYARFVLMGGPVQLTGRMDILESDPAGDPVAARVTGQYALSGIQAASFFDRLTPFREHLAGELGLAGSFGFLLDRHALPERTGTVASGNIAVAGGRIANWPVLQALGGRLGLPALDTVRFQDWAGRFGVTGTMVTLEETAMDGGQIDVRAAGSFDLGGTLDLGATVYLSRELAARAGQLGDRALALAGADGRIPVGVRITGAAGNPDVVLDLSEARDAVVDRAREAAQREAAALAERAADQLADRLEIPDSLRGLSPDSLRRAVGDSLTSLLPDSLQAPPDSLRERAEDALRQRMLRLLPRPDTTPDTTGAGGR